MRLSRRTALLASLATALPLAARAAETIRIGQATPALSFLPVWAARAMDSFTPHGLTLSWAAIQGGDPAALAALDAGDIDLAAVGSDTALAAIGKGQPFQLVYALMAKMSLDVVVSTKLLTRTGVTPTSTLPQRIAALKGAIVGVSAVGGTQDRVIRWIAAQGGLAAHGDLQVAQVGAPPAIQAALENGRIEAFALSPPEAGIAEAGGYGRRLIDPGTDFPSLRGLPNLVLVMRRDPDAALKARIIATSAAMSDASKRVLADPDAAADLIGGKFFAKIPHPIIRGAVRSLLDGLSTGGRFTAPGIAALEAFSVGSGTPVPVGKPYWTNDFIPV